MEFNVGVIGGSYNPLHLGHVNCILQAANRCRELYIVLSVGVHRKEIPSRIRYRWLYQLTKHLNNVKILILEDTLDSKEAYTQEYWQRDAAWIKAQIGKKVDAVFYGDDYGKDGFWSICYPESEQIVFARNGISSTAIRQNPYAHWDWIPKIVRPYYTKKVLLIGSESTGKSTLSVHLAHRFNGGFVEEAGRELSEKSGTDKMMLSEDFTEILLRHKLNEMNAVENGDTVLFVDTDALVTRFYMEFFNDSQLEKNRALSEAIDHLNTYDLVLFLEPDVPFVQDGDRSEVIQNDRNTYSEQIKTLLKRSHRPFVSLSGSYQERYETAVREVETLFCANN